MSTISLTTSSLPEGLLAKAFAALARGWRDRAAAAAFAGMSERELQDIGWGQQDRWAKTLSTSETPPDRRARAIAIAAWHGTLRKAA